MSPALGANVAEVCQPAAPVAERRAADHRYRPVGVIDAAIAACLAPSLAARLDRGHRQPVAVPGPEEARMGFPSVQPEVDPIRAHLGGVASDLRRIRQLLDETDINTLTPVEALMKLNEMKTIVKPYR